MYYNVSPVHGYDFIVHILKILICFYKYERRYRSFFSTGHTEFNAIINIQM